MLNTLLGSAEPLINSVGELRFTAERPDSEPLYRLLFEGLQTFEERARERGVSPPRIDSAARVLRLFVDQSLAAMGCDEPRFSGPGFDSDAFFEFLVEQVNAVDRDHDLLEFLYILLILGLERSLLPAGAGSEDIDRLVAGLGQTVARGPVSGELVLSPHWKSRVDIRRTLLQKVPAWVAIMFSGLLVLGAYRVFLQLADEQTEAVIVEFEFVARELSD